MVTRVGFVALAAFYIFNAVESFNPPFESPVSVTRVTSNNLNLLSSRRLRAQGRESSSTANPTDAFAARRLSRNRSLAPVFAYTRQDDTTTRVQPKLPEPKVGDIVRYYDIDGGSNQGQTLVGKISFIQPIRTSADAPSSNEDGTNRWLVEITELEDVGDGYFAEYPSRKRRKSSLRKLEELAPLPASFVRSEDAFKVPTKKGTNEPLPSHPGYDLVGYEGPMATPINQDIVQQDAENYSQVKMSLIKNAAIAGAMGTIIADLFRGTEDAALYFLGALSGVAYLFFLGIKTDTLGSPDSKLGSNVSNARFVFPALVLVGVALKNMMSGDLNPVTTPGIFSTVTPEQFASVMIGFLTYRVPLFISQLTPVLSESATDMIPVSWVIG